VNIFIIPCLRNVLVIYRIFKYSVSIFVTLLVIFLTNPFITTSAVNQNLPANLLHDGTLQGTSYFRTVDLFSELSRNMTASSSISSDLFENETTIEEDSTNGIIEDGSEGEETIINSNETSSSELPQLQSPSGLLDEENMETEKGQVQDETIQNDADVNTEEDEDAVSEVPRQGEEEEEEDGSDNTINNDLTNSTD
jgi:hypothetical protein